MLVTYRSTDDCKPEDEGEVITIIAVISKLCIMRFFCFFGKPFIYPDVSARSWTESILHFPDLVVPIGASDCFREKTLQQVIESVHRTMITTDWHLRKDSTIITSVSFLQHTNFFHQRWLMLRYPLMSFDTLTQFITNLITFYTFVPSPPRCRKTYSFGAELGSG